MNILAERNAAALRMAEEQRLDIVRILQGEVRRANEAEKVLRAERALSDALAEALRDIVGDDGGMSVDTVRMGRVRLQNYAAARGALGGDTLAEVRR